MRGRSRSKRAPATPASRCLTRPCAARADGGLEVGEGCTALHGRRAQAVLLEAVDPREERAPREHPAAHHEASAVVAPAGRAVSKKALGRAEQGQQRHRGPGRRDEGGEDRAERGAREGRGKRIAAPSTRRRAFESGPFGRARLRRGLRQRRHELRQQPRHVPHSHQRQQRLRRRRLRPVAGRLHPHARQSEGASQHAFHHVHGVHPGQRHARRPPREQAAADSQPLPVAHEAEPRERDYRARERQQQRRPGHGDHDEDEQARVVDELVDQLLALTAAEEHVVAGGREDAHQRQDHAELRRGDGGHEQGARAEPPLRQVPGDRVGEPRDRTQLRGSRLRYGPQHDLALGAAAGGLHVQLLHPEQPLNRALRGVDGLDPPERDRRLVRRDHPAPEVERLARDRVRRVPPAHVADHGRDHDATQREHRARERRHAPGPAPDQQAEHGRDEDLAEVLERREDDLRGVQVLRVGERRGRRPGGRERLRRRCLRRSRRRGPLRFRPRRLRPLRLRRGAAASGRACSSELIRLPRQHRDPIPYRRGVAGP